MLIHAQVAPKEESPHPIAHAIPNNMIWLYLIILRVQSCRAPLIATPVLAQAVLNALKGE